MRIKISQSLIKNWWDYQKGELCGLQFMDKHFDHKADFESSDVQLMGRRFEFEVSGALDYDGNEPEMVTTARGAPTAKMQYLLDMVPYVKMALEKNGIKNIQINVRWSADMGEYDITVRPDIIGEKDGEIVCVDIKSTGLLGNQQARYNEFGWDVYNPDAGWMSNKPKLAIQAVHTKVVAIESQGIENIPFFWYIVSNTGNKAFEIIEADVKQDRIISHYDYLEILHKEISEQIELGLLPHPTVQRCDECPLSEIGCAEQLLIPQTKIAEIT